jgi:hypothetical protein
MKPVFCVNSYEYHRPTNHDFIKSNINTNKQINTININTFNKTDDVNLNISNGYLIKYKNDLYVIVCRHSIENCFHNEIIINKTTYLLQEIYSVPELDISIFQFNHNNINLNNYDILDIENIDCKIDTYNNNIIINSYNENIKAKFNKLVESNIGNEFFTLILQICLNINTNINLYGLSGSCCFNDNNNLIGIVFKQNISENTINLIPIYYLQYIFTVLFNNKIKKLNTIVI